MDQPSRPLTLLDLKVRQTTRVVITHAGVRRYLFWVSIGADGSIYLGLPKIGSGGAFHSAPMDSNREVRFEYADATPLTPEQLARHRHFSYHPSGRFNSAGHTTFSDSWRDLNAPLQLFLIVFEDLAHYPAAPTVRLRDIDLNYAGDGSRPLTAKLYVAPAPQVLELTQPEEEVGIVFRLNEGLVGIKPLHVHLVMGGAPAGEWPPQTIVGAIRKKTLLS